MFGSSAFFLKNQVTLVEGENRIFKRAADSGAWLSFHFCPNCGSTLHWENSRRPDVVCVAVGNFADPSFPEPSRTVWTKTKHAWFTFPETIPSHLENPQ